MFLLIIIFLLGITLLIFCSERFVEEAMILATVFNLPIFLFGITFAAIGTDLPEIANSLISSAFSHGDVMIGDLLGSVLVQMTLVPAILGLIAKFKLRRDEIIIGGCSLLLALLYLFLVIEDGQISRIEAFSLLIFWILLIILSGELLLRRIKEKEVKKEKVFLRLVYLFLYLSGIAIGGYLAVESLVKLSKELKIAEIFLSFFVFSIGTSLPELIFDLTAIKKKQYELAIGDFIGSSIVDAGLAAGIGSLFFPAIFSSNLAIKLGIKAFLGSFLTIALLAFKAKLNRKIGICLLIFYLICIFLI